MDSLFSSVLTCAFIALIVVNFVIQFYVGSRVNGGGFNLIYSLNGTKTFIRGWKDQSLRPVMIVWSGIIGAMLIGICSAAGLSALAQ